MLIQQLSVKRQAESCLSFWLIEFVRETGCMVQPTAGVSLGVLCCARSKTKTSVKNQHGFQRLSRRALKKHLAASCYRSIWWDA